MIEPTPPPVPIEYQSPVGLDMPEAVYYHNTLLTNRFGTPIPTGYFKTYQWSHAEPEWIEVSRTEFEYYERRQNIIAHSIMLEAALKAWAEGD